ncbi:hypothetical protein [Streptomyces sp. H51]|uniref:hypothetical protein n=1 Tax=Streptomyces sp. H51 TaxID=3111770 RepID=UPI002D776350|nr:hypothetical protein [Streptomyces sp. H51]
MAHLKTVERAMPPDTFLDFRNVVHEATASMDVGKLYHFAFWHDLDASPTNYVEQVAMDLFDHLPAEAKAEVVGFEWWLGRLEFPYHANFPFKAHQDVGRNPVTLAREHPSISSVYYLTTNDDGPLVVFDGPPEIEAKDWEAYFPAENSFVMFPGTLWHTVSSREEVEEVEEAMEEAVAQPSQTRLSVQFNWWKYRPKVGEGAGVSKDYRGDIFPALRIQ